MKQTVLTRMKSRIVLASLLFGLFFGAGNLIFPVNIGQLSGSNIAQSSFGFILTAVGLASLGVIVCGRSKAQCFIIHKNRHLSRKQVKYVHNNQSIFCIQYILHLKNLRRHNEYDNLQYRLQIFQGRCSKQRLLYHHNKHNQLNSYE